MSANKMIKYDKFYTDLSLDQITEYFKVVKVFEPKEASTIIKKITQISESDEEANSLIAQIMPSILCPLKKSKSVSYISPCCSQELFNDVVRRNKTFECGKYEPPNIFDFNSNEMIELRETQERSVEHPRFIHSEDTASLILEHSLDKFIDMPIETYENNIHFNRTSKKPLAWEKNIFQAAINGDVQSLKYNIYLLPFLRDITNQNGQSLGHLASKNGRYEIISTLIQMNADLNEADNEGNLPIHFVLNRSTLNAFIAGGYSYEVANKSGDLLIEIKSHPFNSRVIEKLIKLGTNILIPNNKGVYWMQYVLHNSYYPSNNQYVDFQKFVRKIIVDINLPLYKDNVVIQKIIQRKADVSEIYDAVDLRNAVINKDIEQVKSLVAMGTVADNKMYNKTNLMIASENGSIEIARVLCENYCDPNIFNHKGENSFWIASQNNHFEIAIMLLKEFNANPNIVSKTGETLLHIAYKEQNHDLFNFLLKSGASPNIKNNDKQTLQFITFLNKDDETAEKIQNDYNGDINTNGKDGNSLGHLAIINNDFDRLDYLLERKLDINVRNDSGQSLFMWSILNTNNFHLCQQLLDLGANIDIQDNEGNTAFYCICRESEFSPEKFQFMIKNKCNIDIQNKSHDFPISQLIKNGHKKEALLLLDKGSNIIDSESPSEPIVVAVQMHDQFWTNKLIDSNANGMNKKYPLVEKYIKEPFFDINYLHKMKSLNLSIGFPIHAALSKSHHAATFLWNQLTEDEKLKTSNSLDENGFTPLITAIHANDEVFFNELTKEGYNITKTDHIWRTPFIHCCIVNNTNFIYKMYSLVPFEEINKIDRERNSALTYICNNNNRQVADFMFINKVNLYGMNLDTNGIIQIYINRLEEVQNMLLITCERIQRKSNEHEENKLKLKNERSAQSSAAVYYAAAPSQGQNESYMTYQNRYNQWNMERMNYNNYESSKISSRVRYYEEKVQKSEQELSLLYRKYWSLKRATRKEILYSMNELRKNEFYC